MFNSIFNALKSAVVEAVSVKSSLDNFKFSWKNVCQEYDRMVHKAGPLTG